MQQDRATTPMARRLQQAAAAQFVGRDRERAHLAGLLVRGAGPAVVFVSGAGGIGKSALVTATVAGLDLPVVTLDGRMIEPTPAGFLSALADNVGSCSIQSPAQAGAALETHGVAVLVVDSFERLNLLDAWLRTEFLPALPADSTTVLVGRRPPNVAWRTAPGWRPLLAEMVVEELTDDDAAALIARRGLSEDGAARVGHFGRGHPLAVEMAAEAVARHADLDLSDGPPGEVVEALFEVLIDDLDPAERRTVEAGYGTGPRRRGSRSRRASPAELEQTLHLREWSVRPMSCPGGNSYCRRHDRHTLPPRIGPPRIG